MPLNTPELKTGIHPVEGVRMSYPSGGRGIQLKSGNGLVAELTATGRLMGLWRDGILITRTDGSLAEGGLSRIYLRKYLAGGSVETIQLTGTGGLCRSYRTSPEMVVWEGEDHDLSIRVRLQIHGNSSIDWTIFLTARTEAVVEADCIFGLDIGLADKAALQSNEAYVCHYVDQRVEELDPYGPVLMYRQNLPQSKDRHPWIMFYSPTGAAAYATDAHDAFGNGYRVSGQAKFADGSALSSIKQQYEFNYATLQSQKAGLKSAGSATFQFKGIYRENHTEVSGIEDLELVSKSGVHGDYLEKASPNTPPEFPILQEALPYPAEQPDIQVLKEAYPNDWLHTERSDDDILSFFTDAHRHIVTREKERLVDRPHGSILIGASDLKWNPTTTSTTVYMNGIFNAQLVSGNTSLHKLLSVSRESLGLSQTSGQRIFIRNGSSWYRLGTPSFFEMGRDHAKWFYRSGKLQDIDVRVSISHDNSAIQLAVTSESPLDEVVVTNELVMGEKESDLDAVVLWDPSESVCRIHLDEPGDIPDFRFKLSSGGSGPTVMQKFHTEQGIPNILDFAFKSATWISITIEPGSCASKNNPTFWETATNNLQLKHVNTSISRMDEALAWFAHNAVIHYLSPHGLEQYSGAAWGTRDVCQGPLEFLLANGHFAEARDTLMRTYAAQYMETGDWPQWFMLDEYGFIAQDHSHGDIILWPLKALAMYLSRTGDAGLLDEPVDFRLRTPVNQTAGKPASIRQHLYMAIEHLKGQFIRGTHLISYGDGDWDDSLQPAQADLRKRLVSSWTVGLCAQVAEELATSLETSGEPDLVAYLRKLHQGIRQDFHRYLIINGTLCGFLLFNENMENPRPLIHPDDTTTGIDLRLIPINRAIISGLFTREEAEHHLDLVRSKLQYPDGIRLMSRPAPYSGGREIFFRRAESAANFGREIGLQYVHAHIRYAEALAIMGYSNELWDAVQSVNPVGLNESVSNAMLRQSNMYFSSSDGDFRSRNDAAKRLDLLKNGQIGAKGGWRLYSSGPGIYTALIIERLLGLRRFNGFWEIDPVLPEFLDGLQVTWRMENHEVSIYYDVSSDRDNVSVEANGKSLSSSPLSNAYRQPGIRIQSSGLLACLNDSNNKIIISC